MHTAKRAIRRLALIGWLGLFWPDGSVRRTSAQAAAPPEAILPDSTIFLFKLNDVKIVPRGVPRQPVRPALERPGLKDFRDDLVQKLEDATKAAQGEDRRHPQGAARAAPRDSWPSPRIGSRRSQAARRRRHHRRRRREQGEDGSRS